MNTRLHHPAWFVLPLALALSACNSSGEPGAGMAFPPPQVSVVTITPQDLPVEREYIGQTKGSREVEIRPRVGGIIEQRLYEEGTQVAAGAVLFQLDPKSYEAQLAAAEAVLARTEAQRSQAEREWNRIKPLAADKVISRKALDDAQSAFELAEADVKAAAAAVREARLQLDYTRVTAPIAGVAGLAEKVEGAVVEAAKDRLTTLTVTDPMDVYFSVSENELLAQQTEAADGSLQTPADNALQVKVRLGRRSRAGPHRPHQLQRRTHRHRHRHAEHARAFGECRRPAQVRPVRARDRQRRGAAERDHRAAEGRARRSAGQVRVSSSTRARTAHPSPTCVLSKSANGRAKVKRAVG